MEYHKNGPPMYPQINPPMNPPQMTVVSFGPESQSLICPHCHANILTKTETKATSKTHLFAVLLCIFQCWLCCWIPYCVDSCQSTQHYCPHCNAYLGIYDR